MRQGRGIGRSWPTCCRQAGGPGKVAASSGDQLGRKEWKVPVLLTSQTMLQPMQISKWKRELKDNISQVFEKPRSGEVKQREAQEAKLFEKIGRLEMELDWLKKKMESFDS